ncbi:MAG: arginine--tRNA ligase [Bacteroidetes bacterium]|nr:MAG: arginine--tRNA ligase [Bacteroidota bacterium]
MSELRIDTILITQTVEAIKTLYNQSVSPSHISLQKTKNEFEGDITLLVFPLIRASKKSPEETATAIGNYLKENVADVTAFNVVKGFLNLLIIDDYWIRYLTVDPLTINHQLSTISETVMVEFSSPNTNKPLHLGHMRNILLGHSVSEILKAAGRKVIRVNLVNDRGIHICKSMLAWKKWGNEETPESSGMKGDHLVGKYYVMYDQELKKEKAAHPTPPKGRELERSGSPPLGELEGAAQEMLRKWEAGDKDTIDLWKKMNGWVYDGFAKTYKYLGVEFEKIYYESETYLLGKKIVEEGLTKSIFKKKEDGSVWIDLTADGLDEKLLLRSDGTSVYITQDIGTAVERLREFKVNRMIYVVGNEQDYHFKVLFLILKKLAEKNIIRTGSLPEGGSGEGGFGSFYHLSYGMVDLPSGKMKSREGTVVDADELIEGMVNSARETTKALGKTEGMSDAEAETLYHTIGLGALKYFILKVDAKKRMLFDPKESIDFNGNTGPFIQYTYARIKSVLRKAQENQSLTINYQPLTILHKKEKEVIKLIHGFPAVIQEAADTYNPGHIANYVYDLAKEYNQFYHECPILKAENADEKNFRLVLSAKTAEVIKFSLKLLGINVPERM